MRRGNERTRARLTRRACRNARPALLTTTKIEFDFSRGADVYEDPTDWQGEEIFRLIKTGDFLADLDHLFLPTTRIQKYSTGNRYGNGTNVMRFRFAL